MVPTLFGRIQTRIFLLATVGVVITALITPILPHKPSYSITFIVLTAVGIIGIGWELIYHFLMQFRWEKDWPSLFGLITLVPEGLLLYGLLRLKLIPGIDVVLPASTFWIDFVVVWIAVWLVANGPMRVPFVRWRFRGGRLA
jgi:hypothetical protein